MSALSDDSTASNSPSSGSGSFTSSTPRRTRIVISQSRGGCATCKLRRVKCDEQKPLCKRCIQAGRICGGYKHNGKPSMALQPALKTGVVVDSRTERLSVLAAQVLSLDNSGQPMRENGVWGRLFLQLSNQVECVKAAAAAFGAAYESTLNTAVVSSFPWRYYGSALARLQSDISNGTAGPESLALASMILACSETLSQHDQNAYAHFIGAAEIMNASYSESKAASYADIASTIRDELVKFDVAVGGYALSQNPAFMWAKSEATIEEHAFYDFKLAADATVKCLHRAYRFIDPTSQLRYDYPGWDDDNNDSICQDRSDTTSQCLSALDGLAALITELRVRQSSTTLTEKEADSLADFHGLRTQLTAALTFLSCIHSPFQTEYDKQNALFKSIIKDAAAVARLKNRSKANALKRFSTRPGIVSSLFMVCQKCRDPALRAVAMAILNEQGREGPTDGHIMAAIGSRMAAIESHGCTPSSPGASLTAKDIPEALRIHGFAIFPTRIDREGRCVVDVQFARPNDIMNGWGQIDYKKHDNWHFWTEPVEL